jgi:hypothetical protein
MDKVTFHKSETTKALITAKGAGLLFLPPSKKFGNTTNRKL